MTVVEIEPHPPESHADVDDRARKSYRSKRHEHDSRTIERVNLSEVCARNKRRALPGIVPAP